MFSIWFVSSMAQVENGGDGYGSIGENPHQLLGKRPEARRDQLLVIVSVRAVVGTNVDNNMTSVLSG